jgi:hypothetical protein
MYIHTEFAVLFKSSSAYAFVRAYMKRDFDSSFFQTLYIRCHFEVFSRYSIRILGLGVLFYGSNKRER